METVNILAPLLHECGGIEYAHPLLVLFAVLLGAQIPNVVRLCGYVARLVSRFLPYR